MQHIFHIAVLLLAAVGSLAWSGPAAADGYRAGNATASPAAVWSRRSADNQVRHYTAGGEVRDWATQDGGSYQAARRNGRADSRLAQRGGERPKVSLDQAVSKVRSQYGGKVIRAETRNVDGRPVHYVKILSAEGRVRTVRVDGRTGRIQ